MKKTNAQLQAEVNELRGALARLVNDIATMRPALIEAEKRLRLVRDAVNEHVR